MIPGTFKKIKAINEEDVLIARDPFLAGRREAAERYGFLSQNAVMWRRISFGLLVCCFLCVIATIYYSSRFTIIPYVVQVDSHGYELAVQPLNPSQVDSRMIISRIGRYIQSMKTVYNDPVAQAEMMKFVHNTTLAGSSAETHYREYYSGNNPLFDGKSKKVVVTINSVLPLSEHKWQAEWKEDTFIDGKTEGSKQYRGIFDIAIRSPTSMKGVLDNPLGIFIIDFSFSEISY